jgi:hypothetical protein
VVVVATGEAEVRRGRSSKIADVDMEELLRSCILV